jgi:hypothetical protein
MIGEALRETGVLLLVFIPLDHLFSEHPVLSSWGVIVAAVGYGVGLFGLRVVIEETRE